MKGTLTPLSEYLPLIYQLPESSKSWGEGEKNPLLQRCNEEFKIFRIYYWQAPKKIWYMETDKASGETLKVS